MKLTVCGSMAHYHEMTVLQQTLETAGHEVMIPELSQEAPAEFGGNKSIYFGKYIEENGGVDSFPPEHQIWDLKQGAILDHFQKIDWADALLIANYEKRGIPGYVGGNTLIEIGVAFYLKKQLFILNSISTELSYKTEILAMRPVLLDGDLGKINTETVQIA